MSVFAAYARYYDLLYAGKDYAAEAAYVEAAVREVNPAARRILELGCGTGLHAASLAQRGFEVDGVDLSDTMLEAALARIGALDADLRQRVRLHRGNICSHRMEGMFDAVVSLFHVVNYQTGTRDLRSAFENARVHLASGGAFVFDTWYGPAVLTQRPEVRMRRLSDEESEIERIAEPVMHPNENVVDVNYRIVVRERATGREDQLRETHRMRYLFMPEITDLLDGAGFDLVRAEEWLTGRSPGLDTWSVCVIGRAR